jgi:hypothetical protein
MDVMCRAADIYFIKLFLEITKSKTEKLNSGKKCMQYVNLLEGIHKIYPNYKHT